MTMIGLTHDFLSTLPEVPTAPRVAWPTSSTTSTIPTTDSIPTRTLIRIWRYFMSGERLLPSIPNLDDLLVFEFGHEAAVGESAAIRRWRRSGNSVWLVLDQDDHSVDIAVTIDQLDEAMSRSHRQVIFHYPPTIEEGLFDA